MRSAAHIDGHPIHPMLVSFPVAFLIGSACINAFAGAIAARRDRRDWYRTARHMNALGIGTALTAAVPGAVDYLFTVPPESSARDRATSHMLANVSALALFGLARLGRRRADERPPRWAVAAELCGASLVGLAGWLGGVLVNRNQIGVDHRYANAGKWRSEVVRLSNSGTRTIDAGSEDELEVNQMKLLHAGGERIVVARTDTAHVAFADRCTHKGGPLSDGSLACGVVQCPWHGSQFDVRSGEVLAGPAKEPVAVYQTEETQGRIAIDVDAKRSLTSK